MNSAYPLNPEELTPAWMSGALAIWCEGAEVVSVDVLDQHSGTTGRVRLALGYAPGVQGPTSVFVKLPPFDERQRKFVASTDMGRREARFYDGPAQEAPMRIPRAYHAAAGDDPTEYVMVLEDLVAAGCSFTTRLEPQDAGHARAFIEGLARLHAHFWNDSRFDGDWSWLRPAMRGSYGAKLVESARQQFAAEMPTEFEELCRLYVEHHGEIAELWDEGEDTLIHGDTHAGNQFRDGREAGIYDWAVISRSPGIRDVAIYLGNSCPTEVRREEQEGWLARYHQILVEAGVDTPSLETLWDRYRRSVLYAWVAATTTASMGSKWQPIEVGMMGMRRATDTCADLDTLGALRERL
jgi:hypothetical protein